MTAIKKSTRVAKKEIKPKLNSKILEERAVKASKRASFTNYSSGIKVRVESAKSVKVNIAHDTLDAYLSPHILDLSSAKFIEKIKPAPEVAVDYKNLPGGEILDKLYLFNLLDFNKSEVYLGLKKLLVAVRNIFQTDFDAVDFSPKVLNSQEESVLENKMQIWQEVALINLVLFLWSFVAKIGRFFAGLSRVVGNSWNQSKSNDTVIRFELKNLKPLSRSEAKNLDRKDDLIKSQRDNFEDLISMIERPIASPRHILTKTYLEADYDVEPVVYEKRVSDFSFKNQDFKSDFKPRVFKLRAIAIFAAIAIIIVLPIKILSYWQEVKDAKGMVLGEAEVAMTDLESAKTELTSFNLQGAGAYFASANKHFVSAEGQLDQIKSFLTDLAENAPGNNSFKSGKNLLDLGDNLSSAGEHLLGATNELQNISDLSWTSKIKNFKVEGQLALEKLKLAQDDFGKIDPNYLPQSSQDKFNQLKVMMPDFITSLQKVMAVSDFAINFLGDNDLRRYLVVFQNSNELRATGGFMGSFALVDLSSGRLKNITLPPGGTYDVRAGLKELIKAPSPMAIINTMWELQDANWWPDWQTSAQNTAWLYQKSGGASVDGVIAINSGWMKELLKITGPIDLPEYGKKIDADNFEIEIQKEVEINHTNDKKPKQILSDLAPKILDKIFNIQSKDFLGLATAMEKGLNQKDIQIYLKDDKMSAFVKENNWDGSQKQAQFDYLNVVATNIGGGKTDGVINQSIYHQSEVQADGTVIDRVLISRHHFGPIDAYFTILPNRDYFRIYVPQGSKLISAAGFSNINENLFKKPEAYLKENTQLANENQASLDEASGVKTYDENGKTVFANWSIVKPGESQDIVLTYQLPNKLEPQVTTTPVQSESIWTNIKSFATGPKPISLQSETVYSLLWQKQSGRNNDQFSSALIYPESWQLKSVYPESLTAGQNEIGIQATSTEDLFYLAGFK